MSWNLVAYQNNSGKFPVYEFIDNLDQSTQIKITRLLDYLVQNGPFARMPHSKMLNTNLYELRVKGKQEIRIFYCFHKQTIYLLHGFVKKTNKIPEKELTIAEKRKLELL